MKLPNSLKSTLMLYDNTNEGEFTVSSHKLDDGYCVKSSGYLNEEDVLAVFMFCAEALLSEYDYSQFKVINTLVAMLESFDDEEENDES